MTNKTNLNKLFFLFCAIFTVSLALNAHANLPARTQTLAPIIQKTMPSVVAIAGMKKVTSQANSPTTFFSDKEEQTIYGFGSGVIINSKKGYILTNAHVIADLEELEVRLHDNRTFIVEILGTDKATDLALLKINADTLTEVVFADSDTVNVGDFVLAIGNPFRLTHTVTSGIVSALSRNNLGHNGYFDFIQTDAAINVGNSGGGLFNLQGELIGINTMIVAPTGGNVGLAFAIPSNMARSIVTQLADAGRVHRSPLGAYAQDLSPLLRKAFNVSEKQGAVITQVLPKTPADNAGLQIGDVILLINEKPIKNASHLKIQISLMPPESKLALKINRSGKTRILNTQLKSILENQSKGEHIFPGLEGALLEETPKDYPVQGIRIMHIDKNTKAHHADFFIGDVIVAANQKTTPHLDALKSASKRNPNLLLLQIMRNKIPGFVAVTK